MDWLLKNHRRLCSATGVNACHLPYSLNAKRLDELVVYKDRFIAAFLRCKRHYGHITTSRVESVHTALKKWIEVSTGKSYDKLIVISRVFLTIHLLQVIYFRWIQQFALLAKVILLLLCSKMQSALSYRCSLD